MAAKSSTDEAPNMDELRSDLDKLREHLSTISGTVTALAAGIGSDAVDRVQAGAESVKARAEKAGQTLQRTVAEQPLTSVLAAFVVGVLLGLLFGRR